MKHLIFLFLLVLPGLAMAQYSEEAIGIRGGVTAGVEYRFYTDNNISYKFLLGTRDNGLRLHAMKEFHQYELFNFTDQLVFYYGFGVHLGYQRWDKYYVSYNSSWTEEKTALVAGADALAGVEYQFYSAPVSIGMEVKPYVDVFGRDVFDVTFFDMAFTVKYFF